MAAYRLKIASVGTGDGSTTAYTVGEAYVASSVTMLVRGLPRVAANDDGFTETTPATGAITMAVAPDDGDSVVAVYTVEVTDTYGTVTTELTAVLGGDAALGGLPITAYRGDDKDYTFSLVDTEGDGVDLTGATLTLELKTVDGTSPLATLTPGSGITYSTQSGSTLGQATIEISATNTDRAPGMYRYTVKLTTVAGKVLTLIPPSDFEIVIR